MASTRKEWTSLSIQDRIRAMNQSWVGGTETKPTDGDATISDASGKAAKDPRLSNTAQSHTKRARMQPQSQQQQHPPQLHQQGQGSASARASITSMSNTTALHTREDDSVLLPPWSLLHQRERNHPTPTSPAHLSSVTSHPQQQQQPPKRSSVLDIWRQREEGRNTLLLHEHPPSDARPSQQAPQSVRTRNASTTLTTISSQDHRVVSPVLEAIALQRQHRQQFDGIGDERHTNHNPYGESEEEKKQEMEAENENIDDQQKVDGSPTPHTDTAANLRSSPLSSLQPLETKSVAYSSSTSTTRTQRLARDLWNQKRASTSSPSSLSDGTTNSKAAKTSSNQDGYDKTKFAVASHKRGHVANLRIQTNMMDLSEAPVPTPAQEDHSIYQSPPVTARTPSKDNKNSKGSLRKDRKGDRKHDIDFTIVPSKLSSSELPTTPTEPSASSGYRKLLLAHGVVATRPLDFDELSTPSAAKTCSSVLPSPGNNNNNNSTYFQPNRNDAFVTIDNARSAEGQQDHRVEDVQRQDAVESAMIATSNSRRSSVVDIWKQRASASNDSTNGGLVATIKQDSTSTPAKASSHYLISSSSKETFRDTAVAVASAKPESNSTSAKTSNHRSNIAKAASEPDPQPTKAKRPSVTNRWQPGGGATAARDMNYGVPHRSIQESKPNLVRAILSSSSSSEQYNEHNVTERTADDPDPCVTLAVSHSTEKSQDATTDEETSREVEEEPKRLSVMDMWKQRATSPEPSFNNNSNNNRSGSAQRPVRAEETKRTALWTNPTVAASNSYVGRDSGATGLNQNDASRHMISWGLLATDVRKQRAGVTSPPILAKSGLERPGFMSCMPDAHRHQPTTKDVSLLDRRNQRDAVVVVSKEYTKAGSVSDRVPKAQSDHSTSSSDTQPWSPPPVASKKPIAECRKVSSGDSVVSASPSWIRQRSPEPSSREPGSVSDCCAPLEGDLTGRSVGRKSSPVRLSKSSAARQSRSPTKRHSSPPAKHSLKRLSVLDRWKVNEATGSPKMKTRSPSPAWVKQRNDEEHESSIQIKASVEDILGSRATAAKQSPKAEAWVVLSSPAPASGATGGGPCSPRPAMLLKPTRSVPCTPISTPLRHNEDIDEIIPLSPRLHRPTANSVWVAVCEQSPSPRSQNKPSSLVVAMPPSPFRVVEPVSISDDVESNRYDETKRFGMADATRTSTTVAAKTQRNLGAAGDRSMQVINAEFVEGSNTSTIPNADNEGGTNEDKSINRDVTTGVDAQSVERSQEPQPKGEFQHGNSRFVHQVVSCSPRTRTSGLVKTTADEGADPSDEPLDQVKSPPRIKLLSPQATPTKGLGAMWEMWTEPRDGVSEDQNSGGASYDTKNASHRSGDSHLHGVQFSSPGASSNSRFWTDKSSPGRQVGTPSRIGDWGQRFMSTPPRSPNFTQRPANNTAEPLGPGSTSTLGPGSKDVTALSNPSRRLTLLSSPTNSSPNFTQRLAKNTAEPLGPGSTSTLGTGSEDVTTLSNASRRLTLLYSPTSSSPVLPLLPRGGEPGSPKFRGLSPLPIKKSLLPKECSKREGFREEFDEPNRKGDDQPERRRELLSPRKSYNTIVVDCLASTAESQSTANSPFHGAEGPEHENTKACVPDRVSTPKGPSPNRQGREANPYNADENSGCQTIQSLSSRFSTSAGGAESASGRNRIIVKQANEKLRAEVDGGTDTKSSNNREKPTSDIEIMIPANAPLASNKQTIQTPLPTEARSSGLESPRNDPRTSRQLMSSYRMKTLERASVTPPKETVSRSAVGGTAASCFEQRGEDPSATPKGTVNSLVLEKKQASLRRRRAQSPGTKQMYSAQSEKLMQLRSDSHSPARMLWKSSMIPRPQVSSPIRFRPIPRLEGNDSFSTSGMSTGSDSLALKSTDLQDKQHAEAEKKPMSSAAKKRSFLNMGKKHLASRFGRSSLGSSDGSRDGESIQSVASNIDNSFSFGSKSHKTHKESMADKANEDSVAALKKANPVTSSNHLASMPVSTESEGLWSRATSPSERPKNSLAESRERVTTPVRLAKNKIKSIDSRNGTSSSQSSSPSDDAGVARSSSTRALFLPQPRIALVPQPTVVSSTISETKMKASQVKNDGAQAEKPQQTSDFSVVLSKTFSDDVSLAISVDSAQILAPPASIKHEITLASRSNSPNGTSDSSSEKKRDNYGFFRGTSVDSGDISSSQSSGSALKKKALQAYRRRMKHFDQSDSTSDSTLIEERVSKSVVSTGANDDDASDGDDLVRIDENEVATSHADPSVQSDKAPPTSEYTPLLVSESRSFKQEDSDMHSRSSAIDDIFQCSSPTSDLVFSEAGLSVISDQHSSVSAVSKGSASSLAYKAEQRLKEKRLRSQKFNTWTIEEERLAVDRSKRALSSSINGNTFAAPKDLQNQAISQTACAADDEIDSLFNDDPTVRSQRDALLPRQRPGLSSRYNTSTRFIDHAASGSLSEVVTASDGLSVQASGSGETAVGSNQTLETASTASDSRIQSSYASSRKQKLRKKRGNTQSETDEIISERFVDENSTNIQAFQYAVKSMSLGQIAADWVGEVSMAAFDVKKVASDVNKTVRSIREYVNTAKSTSSMSPRSISRVSRGGDDYSDYLNDEEEDIAIEVEYLDQSIEEDDHKDGFVLCSAVDDLEGADYGGSSTLRMDCTKPCGVLSPAGQPSFEEPSMTKRSGKKVADV